MLWVCELIWSGYDIRATNHDDFYVIDIMDAMVIIMVQNLQSICLIVFERFCASSFIVLITIGFTPYWLVIESKLTPAGST